MNERISKILNTILNKEHHVYRQDVEMNLAEEFSQKGISPVLRTAMRLEKVLEAEKPVIMENDRIVIMRTITGLPDMYTKEEWEDIKSRHFIHELGNVSNISPDYGSLIRDGLEKRRKEIEERIEKCVREEDSERLEFLKAALITIDAVEKFSDKYKAEAERIGKQETVEILSQVPRYGARTFHEALQFFRIIHFALWCEGEYHNTIGRFDQYMYPYLKADMEKGILSRDDAMELLEEFFISFNKDSDLYPGVQQGDNGQSLILGGVDRDGNDAYNLLSEMCLIASKELKLIDPKINLRVNKNTTTEVYRLATELTKEGLGFPQYSNDDVVIPGLTALGYDLEDARDYTVAACWEFIIPGYGMDVPNIGALSFPYVVDLCMHKHLTQSDNFETFMSHVKKGIFEECSRIADGIKNLWMIPAPFMSILMKGCIENAKDISLGAKYNNFGIHGTGISTAVDSLAAIKKYVYDTKYISPEDLIKAVDDNFESHAELLNKLRIEAPKLGNDDEITNDILVELLNTFSEALAGKKNERGGCYRAGTGSAMYYLWHAAEIGASPDGRRKGEPFGANYSPSLFAKIKGPLSVIKSFTKPDLSKVINGGPLTMEFHGSIFADKESLWKVADLVKYFVEMGGHQLQLNAVNRDKLIGAQKHPENYRQLIVRIWGWSAYFVELDREYQDHVIRRQEYV